MTDSPTTPGDPATLPLMGGPGPQVGARTLAGSRPGRPGRTVAQAVFPLAPPRIAEAAFPLAPQEWLPTPPEPTSAQPTPPTTDTAPTPAAPPSVTPAQTPAPADGARVGEGVLTHALTGAPDWALVGEIRDLATARWQSTHPDQVLDRARDETTLRELIEDELLEHSKNAHRAGRPALSFDARTALTNAVVDGVFGAGRFQRFLDLPDVRNIEIEGYERIHIQFADGHIEAAPSPWGSDEELIGDIQHLARTCPTGEKQFSITHRVLRMALPDGSRLAAEAWVTARPSVTIRRHPYLDTDLEQSRRLGLIYPGLQDFFEAAFRAGKTIVICGDPGAGKTTFARALLACLHPMERIATMESMYELLAHQMPHRHQRVWAAEAQQGGEIGPDGRPSGGIDLMELVQLSLQKNVTRLIVGEVIGPEMSAMINAMQGGRGSLSTLHARSAKDAVERMANLILQAQSNASLEFAYRQVALNIDYVVHIAFVNEGPIGGSEHRFIDEVVELSASEDPNVRYTLEHLWAPGTDGRAHPTGCEPRDVTALQRWGLSRQVFHPDQPTWEQPLRLLIPQGAHR